MAAKVTVEVKAEVVAAMAVDLAAVEGSKVGEVMVRAG